MEEIVKYNGYTFEKLSSRDYREFRVKCLETGDENWSNISFESAMNLIIQNIERSIFIQQINSENKEQIEEIFKEFLLNKKLSEVNDIVKEKIADRKIRGKIVAIDRDKFDMEQVYLTEKFVIRAICERRVLRIISKITVEDRM